MGHKEQRVVWKYRNSFYVQNDEGRFVETDTAEGDEVFEIIPNEAVDPPLNFTSKYEMAYPSYQSVKAKAYYREIMTSLRLLPSKTDLLPTLRSIYGEVLERFKSSRYWRSMMDQTPMAMARRFAWEDNSESWLEFSIKLIDRINRIEDAYCYWLILRWLKLKIAYHEANPTSCPQPLTEASDKTNDNDQKSDSRLLIRKAHSRAQSVSSFDDLFKNPEDTQLAVRVLYDVTSRNKRPVIDDSGFWIGRKGSKSVLIAWIEVLRQRGKFKTMLSDLQVSELLNNYFPGLSLDLKDTSLWRKRPDCQGRYHADFLHLIK